MGKKEVLENEAKQAEIIRKSEGRKNIRNNMYFFRTLCDVEWKSLENNKKQNFYTSVVFMDQNIFNRMMHANVNAKPKEAGIKQFTETTGIGKDFYLGTYMVDIGVSSYKWEEFFSKKDTINDKLLQQTLTDKEINENKRFVREFKRDLRDKCIDYLKKEVEDIPDYTLKCIIYYVKKLKPLNITNVALMYKETLDNLEKLCTQDLHQFHDDLIIRYEEVLYKKYTLVKAYKIIKEDIGNDKI